MEHRHARKTQGDAGNWDVFALVLVDVQRDFWTENMSMPFPDYERNVKKLLALCRRERIDIVHLRAMFQRDKSDWMAKYKVHGQIPCIEGTRGAEVFGCAVDEPQEVVISKQTFDGYQNPRLPAILEANNKRVLLIAGLVTSVCVLLTAATAAQLGYLVGIVEDCCADQADAHEQTLQRYPFVFDRTSLDRILAGRDRWLDDLRRLGPL